MATTREKAHQAITKLQVAPIFLQSYEMKRLPENLDIFFGPPEEFFLAIDTQDAFTDGGLVPILDDGNFGLITFYDPQNAILVQKDIESPGEVRGVFQSWQQYLADLMIRIAESVDDDDRVRRMSDLVQFRHIDALLAFLSLPHDDFDLARRRFISNLK